MLMKSHQFKIVLLFTLLICANYSIAHSGIGSAANDRKQLLNILQEEQLPSIAITYIENGYIRYRQALTNPVFSSQPQVDELSINTSFPSRIFQNLILTTTVLKLSELGKLSLDHSIADYLGPSFKSTSKDLSRITLRHLLTHTSGVVANEALVHGLLAESSNMEDLCASLYDRLEKQRKINRASVYSDNAPGEVFEYSSLGVFIARCIVANLSDIAQAQTVKNSPPLNIGPLANNFSIMPSDDTVQGNEFIQCAIGKWGCWAPQIEEPMWLRWLPTSFSYVREVNRDQSLGVDKFQLHTYASMNELTRLMLSLLQNDNTPHRGNLLTQESIDEFFIVQFPLSEDYMHRMFGLYLGEEKFKVESNELGTYTYVFLDRKDESSLIVMTPMKNNYKVQRAIAKVMQHFGL